MSDDTGERRGRGRPPNDPENMINDYVLDRCRAYASRGLTKVQIGKLLGLKKNQVAKIPAEMLRRFDEEFDTGVAQGVAQVSDRLLKAALAGEQWAVIFYLRHVGKWTERVDLTVNDRALAYERLPPELKTIMMRAIENQQKYIEAECQVEKAQH